MAKTPANELLDAYDDAVQALFADEETGWDQDGCRAVYRRRIRRIRKLLLRRLDERPLSAGELRDM